MNTIKPFEQFRNQFREVCLRHGGTFSARDTIGDGSAYHIPTPWGTLRASIHNDSAYSGRRYAIQSIFLQWRDYSGPKDFPLHGDFNRFSHKWNITMGGESMVYVRSCALSEFNLRLELLGEISARVVTIADTYADMISAVNRGDLDGAQQLAARIAA